MNKSYKLLGSFWDRRDSKVIAMPLLVKDYDLCYCEDYKVEYNLFDIDGGKRKIKFSELLKLKDFTAFEAAMKKIKWCNEIFIHVDYIPKNFKSIIARFVTKRLVQAYKMIIGKNPKAKVRLVLSDEAIDKIMPYLEENISISCQ